ncbi:MAG TPA: ribonuclease P protein component [Thermoanaerobaculia bacterium]|nr:ribonuclease P protein component [Thermoanaerobaculia bacterium]
MNSSPSEALPKKERIAKRREFVLAYEEGARQFGRYSVVFTRANTAGHPRLGVTATKKLGKAHVRNRVRRWTREVYRRNRGPLGLEGAAFDFVVNLKASAAEAGFDEFSADLIRTIRRALESIRRRERES